MAAVESCVGSLAAKLAGSVGYALRKSRRGLAAGPRRALIVESLATTVSLLAELADPKPEFVVSGGLSKLAKLAGNATVAAKVTEPIIELASAPEHACVGSHLCESGCRCHGWLQYIG